MEKTCSQCPVSMFSTRWAGSMLVHAGSADLIIGCWQACLLPWLKSTNSCPVCRRTETQSLSSSRVVAHRRAAGRLQGLAGTGEDGERKQFWGGGAGGDEAKFQSRELVRQQRQDGEAAIDVTNEGFVIMKHEEEHEGQWGGEEEQAVRVAQAQSALRHET
eukprot:763373-Hanusia_phi.AAC.8